MKLDWIDGGLDSRARTTYTRLMLYQLKQFCDQHKLPYKALVRKLQRKQEKPIFRAVKLGRDWFIDEETKKELLGKEQTITQETE